jgi:hypothetical protein
VCADFPNLADHWSGLKASRPVGDQIHGVGARRQVDLAPVGSLVETVTACEEGRTLATTNRPSALVPFKQAEAKLTLEPDADGTAITFDYRYVPRGGPMGRLTGPVIDRMLRSNFEHADRHRGGRPQRGRTRLRRLPAGMTDSCGCSSDRGGGNRTAKDVRHAVPGAWKDH